MASGLTETAPATTASLATNPAVGTHLGKYELLHILGTGGMGVVWAARDPDLDRRVAIKLIRKEHASPEQRARLLREARAMARLKHPNVLTVYEVDSDGDRDFIVMELVDGASLDAWLGEKPRIADVWDALLAAGRGLAAAHEGGLVHRDFKPHNVLRSTLGAITVTDFGLARGRTDDASLLATLSASPGAPSDPIADVQLTTTGQLLGTPAYMAPEQFAGETPDPRTDQFAFCVTAWEALGGARPYRGTTIEQLRDEATRGVPAPTKLPANVRAILLRGLSPDPAKRWPDMATLLRALERARRSRLRRVLTIAPIVIAIIGTIALLVGRGRPAVPTPAVATVVTCESGDVEFARAWSPEIRGEIVAKFPKAAGFTSEIDAVRERWIAGYTKACASPVRDRATIDCALGTRDGIAVLAEILHRTDPRSLGMLDTHNLLSDTCRPRIPDAKRAAIIEFLARLYGNTASAPDIVRDGQANLRSAATSLGWAPLAIYLELALAEVSPAETAVAGYRKAAELARDAHDGRSEAIARLRILAIERDHAIGSPRQAFEDDVRDAEVAIVNAGSPATLTAQLDSSLAVHAIYVESEVDRGIALVTRAYDTLHRANDRKNAALVGARAIHALIVRSNGGDLDNAERIAGEIREMLEPFAFERGTLTFAVHDALYWVAWLRHDIDGAHAVLDVDPFPVVFASAKIHGRVVDASGHSVANATVVTWTGDVFGDAGRIVTDPNSMGVQHATTDAQGAFEIAAAPESAMMAELGDRRSIPIAAKDGVVATLGPTHAITGHVVTRRSSPQSEVFLQAVGVEPFVRFAVTPSATWSISAAPERGGTFTIGGIPKLAGRLGAVGTHFPRDLGRRIDAGPAVDNATITWPTGGYLDIATKKTGTAWVFRGAVAPKSHAEIDALVARSTDVATARFTPIGWGNSTPLGLKTYAVGESHVVFRDLAPGEITICADLEGAITCRQEVAPDDGGGALVL